MSDKRLWLETDYFDSFRCKGGACRNSCCEGWQIAVSMKEYFDLIGRDYSPEVHHRLECAFRVPENPSPEHFRVISPNWLGRCPLHDADGLCMLHRECGADALPEICRVYPRSLKNEGGMNQACCSASCEAVVEILMDEDRLDFILAEMEAEPEYSEELDEQTRNIGLSCMKILQKREINIARRILEICNLVRGREMKMDKNGGAALNKVLRAIEELMGESASLQTYGDAAIRRYDCEGGYVRYLEDALDFGLHYPQWQKWYENILANHLLYMDIPCVDRRLQYTDAADGLCLLYGFMRVIGCAWCAQRHGRDDFVDVIAGIYRLAEHSPFYYNAHVICRDSEDLLVL